MGEPIGVRGRLMRLASAHPVAAARSLSARGDTLPLSTRRWATERSENHRSHSRRRGELSAHLWTKETPSSCSNEARFDHISLGWRNEHRELTCQAPDLIVRKLIATEDDRASEPIPLEILSDEYSY